MIVDTCKFRMSEAVQTGSHNPYKTSKQRLREHFKTPRRSSHNQCFSIKMKRIHVDLLSSPVSLQYKSRGDGWVSVAGGLNYKNIFFKPTFFIYFGLFLFCTRTFTFFSLSTGSQLIEISIEDTGTPPGLLIIFWGGGAGGLPVFPILIMCKLGNNATMVNYHKYMYSTGQPSVQLDESKSSISPFR